MQNISHRKRFIAGAVCPQCQQLDTIALCHDNNNAEYILCVHCHYQHTQRDAEPVRKQPSTVKPIVWQQR